MTALGGPPPGERVRVLLLRGDGILRSTRPERLDRALELFEDAREVAAEASLDASVRELVERRIAEVRRLIDERR